MAFFEKLFGASDKKQPAKGSDEQIEKNREFGNELYHRLQKLLVTVQRQECRLAPEQQLRFAELLTGCAEGLLQAPPIDQDEGKLEEALTDVCAALEEIPAHACGQAVVDHGGAVLEEGLALRKSDRPTAEKPLSHLASGTQILRLYITIEKIKENDDDLQSQIDRYKQQMASARKELKTTDSDERSDILASSITVSGTLVKTLETQQNNNRIMINNHETSIGQMLVVYHSTDGDYSKIREETEKMLGEALKTMAENNATLHRDVATARDTLMGMIAVTDENKEVVKELFTDNEFLREDEAESTPESHTAVDADVD